ncbi:MAG: AAA family ATPase [Lachnospiraceae bacterium]|nr:AAA family ATPase [Lachnospiraceae bacterium]
MIRLINHSIGTKDKLTCISRPRRFGKSYASQMLCAYYDCSCDSRELFDDREIAATEEYKKHLNQYPVVGIDVAEFVSMLKNSTRQWQISQA